MHIVLNYVLFFWYSKRVNFKNGMRTYVGKKKPSCRYRIGLVSFKETFSNKLYIFIDLNFYSRYDFAFFMYFIWRKIWLEKVGIVGRYINYLWIPSAGWKEKKSSNCVPGHGSQSSTLLLLLITIGNCFYFRWCFHF